MYIDYVANIRLPTEKAHGVQIMKMCEAFARAETDVHLIVSGRKSSIMDDPFRYYGVQKQFPITRPWSLDTVSWGAWGFRLQSITFAFAALSRLRAGATVYGRDELVLWIMSLFSRNPIVWESHTGAWNFFARALLKRCTKIVVISQGLKDFYTARGIAEAKIIVAHDGVDLSAFEKPESSEVARTRLGLPQDKKIVMYIGRLDGWKGVDTLLEASTLLPADIYAVVIGGESHQVEAMQYVHPQVRFLGYRPYREIANNLAAADVLVLPNTAKDPISAQYTSPLKLFGYMASGKPMVASDLPSVREVLSDDSAFFVEPDSDEALAAGIREALAAPEEASRRARAARARVSEYTWNQRAKTVLDSLV